MFVLQHKAHGAHLVKPDHERGGLKPTAESAVHRVWTAGPFVSESMVLTGRGGRWELKKKIDTPPVNRINADFAFSN